MPLQVVITGGPGTGKTSVLNLLDKKFPVMKESARLVLARNKLFKGKDAKQASGKKFQEAVWDLEVNHFAKGLLRKEKVVFFDRGFFDGFAYAQLGHLNGLSERVTQGKHIKYDLVFLMAPLPQKYYTNDTKRKETYTEAKKIHQLIAHVYKKYGYKPITVPFNTVQNRARFIIQKVTMLKCPH
ncbi:ATP-binding protein [Candidatus Pacearchaeota archaeon]|nr:ATP-binding protein [Candidatus Pacearchaeota archaeon]